MPVAMAREPYHPPTRDDNAQPLTRCAEFLPPPPPPSARERPAPAALPVAARPSRPVRADPQYRGLSALSGGPIHRGPGEVPGGHPGQPEDGPGALQRGGHAGSPAPEGEDLRGGGLPGDHPPVPQALRGAGQAAPPAPP